MPKRVPLDTDLFKFNLPPAVPVRRDPLETLIPTSPPSSVEPERPAANMTPRHRELPSVGNSAVETSVVFEAKSDANVAPSERPATGKLNRVVVRRAFDVYTDHVIDLQRIQLMAVTAGRKKPQIGVMVRTALDKFIASELKKYGIH